MACMSLFLESWFCREHGNVESWVPVYFPKALASNSHTSFSSVDLSRLSEMSVAIWNLKQWLFTYKKKPSLEKESQSWIQFFHQRKHPLWNISMLESSLLIGKKHTNKTNKNNKNKNNKKDKKDIRILLGGHCLRSYTDEFEANSHKFPQCPALTCRHLPLSTLTHSTSFFLLISEQVILSSTCVLGSNPSSLF